MSHKIKILFNDVEYSGTSERYTLENLYAEQEKFARRDRTSSQVLLNHNARILHISKMIDRKAFRIEVKSDEGMVMRLDAWSDKS